MVGFSWDGADEKKMMATFRQGRSLFAHYVDLQAVGQSMGYHHSGLSQLAKLVLGVPMKKSKAVCPITFSLAPSRTPTVRTCPMLLAQDRIGNLNALPRHGRGAKRN